VASKLTKILDKTNLNETLWQLFHINASCIRAKRYLLNYPSNQPSRKKSSIIPYINFPLIRLYPPRKNINTTLTHALTQRKTTYTIKNEKLTISEISDLLHYSYSINNETESSSSRETYNTSPSAGGIHPIEIFFNIPNERTDENSINHGIYYYNPKLNELRHIINQNCNKRIFDMFMQPELASNSSVQIFIVANFSETTIKYGDRGYKFAILEAGHIAQNFNLVATALGLASINIGGYYEDEINELLGFDGVMQSVVYSILIGKEITPNSAFIK
jgi:SagB-type dehydrogenase family enzyme